MSVHNVASIKGEPFGTFHRALRAETRADHMMIDQMILRLDLAQREDYGLFLNIHHSALQDLKSEWRCEDSDDFRAMSRNLQNDLQVLGITATPHRPTLRPALTLGNRLGVAYVIRGSRLGANVLRKRVPPRFVTSYLDFTPTLSWAHFLQQLERPPEDAESEVSLEVIRGAQITFELFSHLLTQALA